MLKNVFRFFSPKFGQSFPGNCPTQSGTQGNSSKGFEDRNLHSEKQENSCEITAILFCRSNIIRRKNMGRRGEIWWNNMKYIGPWWAMKGTTQENHWKNVILCWWGAGDPKKFRVSGQWICVTPLATASNRPFLRWTECRKLAVGNEGFGLSKWVMFFFF